MTNVLVIVDNVEDIEAYDANGVVITFAEYLQEHPKKGEKKIRLINLCDTTHYLSRGYYCSLLAEARGHRVLPSVNTINDLRNEQLYMAQISEGLFPDKGKEQDPEPGTKETIYVYFGHASDPRYEKLAQRLFTLFPAPSLKVVMTWKSRWKINSIQRVAFAGLPHKQRPAFMEALNRFTEQHWKRSTSRKRYRWDMAILVEPDEAMPPSNKLALSKLVKAAEKININADLITAADYTRLNEYDALFIRTTTAIDHYTYRFSRKADIEGMVVVDDPTSILRCCNKVFLQDAFTYNKVPSLATQAVFGFDGKTVRDIEQQFDYPMVLKVPESSFSRGVFKVAGRDELVNRLEQLLAETAIVLVQEYLYTDYDWRIGVFNNRPLFACRYFMARNHWQIYNHSSERHSSGDFETMPTFEVPKPVLDAALKASKVIGDGLYGVDIKQLGKQAYVVEVNDNPSLDHKVEDVYLGDELYMLVMNEMVRRLELRGR